ncbi:MAG: YicC/YloC family endoribonuclease [Bacteroidota bacterium]|nr:YicC/YloC family endoribonuclease [Bacteroidota bacterium]MDP4226591.1 YicC/YloC family endoribonuclease [Bacteroidota bacterium]MDP4273148.1 YicC/YloC family endoribonuclease [Bacteroidota bacterium]
MLRSMTGYGKAVTDFCNKKITIEIKSLNSKQLESSFKLPYLYKEKELELRNRLLEVLQRGKIDVSLSIDQSDEEQVAKINVAVVKNYYSQISSLKEELGLTERNDILPIILKLPDSLKTEKQELNQEEWNAIQAIFKTALEELDSFRMQEGAALKKDLTKRVALIEEYLNAITPFEQQRIENIKKRLNQNLKEFFSNETIDQNRFEQELIYFLEKLDITEEKVRLKNHIKYFRETIEEEGAVGKKLGFIAQEMGREINTIGSKANDSDMQKLVVKMKDELEKIKEQLMNVL